MTTRNELHKAIRVVLNAMDYIQPDTIELDDDLTWDDIDSAIETLQSVINEE